MNTWDKIPLIVLNEILLMYRVLYTPVNNISQTAYVTEQRVIFSRRKDYSIPVQTYTRVGERPYNTENRLMLTLEEGKISILLCNIIILEFRS